MFPVKEKRGNVEKLFAIVLFNGDTPREIADKLNALALDLMKGEAIEYSDGQDKTMVREAEHAGENPFFGRYFGVGYDGEGFEAPVALFKYDHDAEAFANGGLYENPEDKPSKHGIVTRCDVVLTCWNSFDPDPVKP